LRKSTNQHALDTQLRRSERFTMPLSLGCTCFLSKLLHLIGRVYWAWRLFSRVQELVRSCFSWSDDASRAAARRCTATSSSQLKTRCTQHAGLIPTGTTTSVCIINPSVYLDCPQAQGPGLADCCPGWCAVWSIRDTRYVVTREAGCFSGTQLSRPHYDVGPALYLP
jgi:hypothetical protein